MTDFHKWWIYDKEILIWMRAGLMKYYPCKIKLLTQAGLALSTKVTSWRLRLSSLPKMHHLSEKFKTWSMHLEPSTTVNLWWKINYSTTRTHIQIIYHPWTPRSTTSVGLSPLMSCHLECRSVTCLCYQMATGPTTMSDRAVTHRKLRLGIHEKASSSRTRRFPSLTVTPVSYAKRARVAYIAQSMST